MKEIISEGLFKKVNRFRATKKHNTYYDIDAAFHARKSESKPPLSIDPFVRFFDYGNAEGKEGYWSYDHMACQL